MKYRNSLLSGAFCTGLLVLSACETPQQIAYFQDFNQNPDTLVNLKSAVITAKPTDKLYIGVKSKDPQISQLFNLTGSSTSYSTSSIAKDAYYYTVDSKGNIDFPVLGTLHVAGRTREQIAEEIKKVLVERNLVKDPVVTVSLTNLHYSVMGEVARPGQYEIEDEKVTILDALSKAGDLTIYGTRWCCARKTATRRSTRSISARETACSTVRYITCSRTTWFTSAPTRPRLARARSMATMSGARASGLALPHLPPAWRYLSRNNVRVE